MSFTTTSVQILAEVFLCLAWLARDSQKPLNDRQTGDIIAENFNTMLNEWNISAEQVHWMIRDEGSNMRLALFIDLDCTIHKMQIAIWSSLQSKDKTNKIVKKIHPISTIWPLVKNKCKTFRSDWIDRNLVFQYCETRWNSTFHVWAFFVKQKMRFTPTTINCINFARRVEIIECSLEVLKPF